MPSTAEQLMKLAEMKEKGLLDMAEFQDQKAKIMAGNGVVADGIAVAMPSNGDREARERQEKIEREEKRERQERQERQDRQDRADAQLAAERQANQMMLATAAATKQGPVINNNNAVGGGGPANTVIVREGNQKIPVNHCQHAMCCVFTAGVMLPCWVYACMGCGCEKPCGC